MSDDYVEIEPGTVALRYDGARLALYARCTTGPVARYVNAKLCDPETSLHPDRGLDDYVAFLREPEKFELRLKGEYVPQVYRGELNLPYAAHLCRWTGFDFRGKAAARLEAFLSPLHHVCVVTRVGQVTHPTDGGSYLEVEGYGNVYPSDKGDPARIERAFRRAVEDLFGERDGPMPARAKIPKYPRTSHNQLWDGFVHAWWLGHATQAQQDLLRRVIPASLACRFSPIGLQEHGPVWLEDPAGRVDYDGKGRMATMMKQDDFRLLMTSLA